MFTRTKISRKVMLTNELCSCERSAMPHLHGVGGRGVGRVMRRCWVNFQCRVVLLILIIIELGPIALAIGAGGDCLDIFSSIFSPVFLPLCETARYRLKYCLKGRLNPKNQPTTFKRIKFFCQINLTLIILAKKM